MIFNCRYIHLYKIFTVYMFLLFNFFPENKTLKGQSSNSLFQCKYFDFWLLSNNPFLKQTVWSPKFYLHLCFPLLFPSEVFCGCCCWKKSLTLVLLLLTQHQRPLSTKFLLSLFVIRRSFRFEIRMPIAGKTFFVNNHVPMKYERTSKEFITVCRPHVDTAPWGHEE